MQSLQNAVQEFENFTQSISDGINKDQVKGLASDVSEQSKNVLQQTLNLLANVGIGLFYGAGVSIYLTLLFPFKLFYKKVFKRSSDSTSVVKL